MKDESMSQLPIDPAALSTAIAVAMQGLGGDGDFQFMKMTKAGEFLFGADEIVVQDGSLWAIDPRSITKGFIHWGDDADLLGEEMAQVFGGQPVMKAALPDAGVGWTEQVGFALACTNGEDKGTQCLYKSNSKGGLKAIKSYLSALQGQLATDPANAVALVSLSSDFYKHKTYGRIYNPIITIDSWVPLDATQAPEKAAKVEPAKVEPEKAAKVEPEQAEPKKRTRRRAV
jgi:hypothetical protein